MKIELEVRPKFLERFHIFNTRKDETMTTAPITKIIPDDTEYDDRKSVIDILEEHPAALNIAVGVGAFVLGYSLGKSKATNEMFRFMMAQKA